MALVIYDTLSFLALFSYGLYHLVSATRAHLKPSSPSPSYSARPYHPLPHRHPHLRHLPLYLVLLLLLLAAAHHAFFSPSSSSLSSSPVRLASLQASAALLLLLLLAASLLLTSALPGDLLFLLGAVALFLLSAAFARSAAARPPADLQAKCDALSAAASAAAAAASLALALNPRLFVAELALAGAIALQGLWSLQTGLSLYVDAFIPEGCHRLLDLPGGGAATRCDLDDLRLRAEAILDLAFVLHAALVAVIVAVVYSVVAGGAAANGGSGGGGVGGGGLARRHNGGSYEALPTSSSTGALTDPDHIQMKALSKNSTQA